MEAVEENASSPVHKRTGWVRVSKTGVTHAQGQEDEANGGPPTQDDPQTIDDCSEETWEEDEEKTLGSPRESHASLYESLSVVPTSPRSVSLASSYVALSLPCSALSDVSVEAAHGAQLANAVFITDIEKILDRVWRPAGDESCAGMVSNLSLSDVLHRCDVIVTSMRAVMCCDLSAQRSKNAAADVLAWIVLQRGSAPLLRSKDVAADVIRLVQDPSPPVSDAGRRTIRNLVSRSLEYCKVIIKSHAFKVLGCQVQKSYTCAILSSITGTLKAAENATAANLLTRVFNICVVPILSSLSEEMPSSHIAHAFQSLTSLMRPRLAEKILSDPKYLLNICSKIVPDEHPFVQEAALVLIDSLLHLSYRVDEIHEYLMEANGVTNLFSLLRFGNSDQELLVLHTLKCMQSSQIDGFERSIGIEELTRIQVILNNGQIEHKKLALVLMSGVLEGNSLLWNGINDLEISRTIMLLLREGDVDMKLRALELFNSPALSACENVIPEILSHEGGSILKAILESLEFSQQPQLYSLLSSILTHGGEKASLVREDLFPLVSKNICNGDSAMKFDAVIPFLRELKLEHMDDGRVSIAIEHGFVQFVLDFCASVVRKKEPSKEKYFASMEDLLVALRFLDRAVKQDAGKKAVFAARPNVLDNDGILTSMLRSQSQGVVELGLDCFLQLAASKEPNTEPVHSKVLDQLVAALKTSSVGVQKKILRVILQFLPRVRSNEIADSRVLCAVSNIFQKDSGDMEIGCLALDIMGSIGLIDAELTARSILRNSAIEDCAWNQYISWQENLSPDTRKSVLHVFNELRKQKSASAQEGTEQCPVALMDPLDVFDPEMKIKMSPLCTKKPNFEVLLKEKIRPIKSKKPTVLYSPK